MRIGKNANATLLICEFTNLQIISMDFILLVPCLTIQKRLLYSPLSVAFELLLFVGKEGKTKKVVLQKQKTKTSQKKEKNKEQVARDEREKGKKYDK